MGSCRDLGPAMDVWYNDGDEWPNTCASNIFELGNFLDKNKIIFYLIRQLHIQKMLDTCYFLKMTKKLVKLGEHNFV